jgi:hypothetical protein
MVRKRGKSNRQQKPEKTVKIVLEGDADYDGSTPLRDPQQELFCIIFSSNTLPKYWGNGQNSYAFAYGHSEKIDKIEEEVDALQELIGLPKKQRKGKSIAELERAINSKRFKIQSIYRACAASAARLLVRGNIKIRCGALLDKLATHVIVDRELTWLIQQRDNVDIKLGAIAHHDKREQRIREKIDMSHDFAPIDGINYVRPVKK